MSNNGHKPLSAAFVYEVMMLMPAEMTEADLTRLEFLLHPDDINPNDPALQLTAEEEVRLAPAIDRCRANLMQAVQDLPPPGFVAAKPDELNNN